MLYLETNSLLYKKKIEFAVFRFRTRNECWELPFEDGLKLILIVPRLLHILQAPYEFDIVGRQKG